MDYSQFTRFNGEPDFRARPQTRPYRIAQGQFYITNVCNLACEGCFSMNNLRFREHMSWADTEARAEQWARLVDIDWLSIIGGEPFANPELDVWVRALRRLWPQTQEFTIVTNGTYLRNWDQSQIQDWFELGVTLEISCHDPQHWPGLVAWCSDILRDLTEPYTIDLTYRDGVLTHNYRLEDGSRLIALGQHWTFGAGPVKTITDHGLEFWDSDPQTAHRHCAVRTCHYFVNGVMYKCSLTAAQAAGLSDQFQIRPDQRELLAQSRGCDPLTAPTLNAWFAGLDRAIPQCRLCPEYWGERTPIWPLSDRKPEVARVSLDRLHTTRV